MCEMATSDGIKKKKTNLKISQENINILGHSSAITRLSFLPDAARLISIGTRLKKGDISLGQSGNTVSIGTRLDEAATFLWGQPVNTLFAD